MPPVSGDSGQDRKMKSCDTTCDTSGGATIDPGQNDSNDSTASVLVQRDHLIPARRDTIVLRAHNGDGYVLPYLPWDATRLQIEKIYELKFQGDLLEAVKDNRFSVTDEDGNIIMPSLWEQIVRPSASLQIVLPSDILNPNIASRYPREEGPALPYHGHSPSIVRPDDDAASEEVFDVLSSVSDGDDDGTGSNETSDLTSMSSESEASDSSTPQERPDELTRQVWVPTDSDGTSLVFQVDTTHISSSNMVSQTVDTSTKPDKGEPQKPVGNTEQLRITKVVSTQSEGWTTLQLHVLPGPRTAPTDPDISIRWFHLHSERLDFASFKKTCLGVSGLSERLRRLVGQMLGKVEKEKLKVLLGGMFIEPGTVLRADESHQPNPQSVIFSCIPYFDLQIPAKQTPNTASQFSSRTLMQSYYPYEPVQDRDTEQAYRSVGKSRRDDLIHVPNTWMMNIGPDIVVTCGHRALSKDFTQSIEMIESSRTAKEDGSVSTCNIRLLDWNHRKLLYALDECRSFFQMEQRLRELRWCTARSPSEKSLQLLWHTSAGVVKVLPSLWPTIIGQSKAIFIDISLPSDRYEENQDINLVQTSSKPSTASIPFFHWPQSLGEETSQTRAYMSDDKNRPMQCLEAVEKAMLAEVLSNARAYSPVEKSFTSTSYYLSLPEETAERVKAALESIPAIIEKSRSSLPIECTVHEALVSRQWLVIETKSSELYDTWLKTLALFVDQVDGGSALRKLWGAMKNICGIASLICTRLPLREHDSASDQASRTKASQGWFVRPDLNTTNVPASLQQMKRSFEKCRKCGSNEVYGTTGAALKHLNKHLQLSETAASVCPEQWIASYSQKELETWNDGTINILTVACETAQRLFVQAKELSDGVRNEDGQMSALYKFPRTLLGTFHQLLVFYLSIERSLFYTERSFLDEEKAIEIPEYMTGLPFSENGLEIIEVFGNGVQLAVASVREELCSMVKSRPVEVFKRLSLSPEYACSWFMRRLLVKPLEQDMTAVDMYREYLSTIQFQVNHRPGKRLLRSIKLVQEEIAALRQVNRQQSKLVSNYMSVLDDATYEKEIPDRSSVFPFERMVLESCQDSLETSNQEYRYMLARCGPLSDNTKQSLEIDEEDHGKAIMVFTIVTVIFLPLSFVTSFLGMNTTDIRDMGSSSSLFWAIAVPLTAFTMGSVLYIGYNGDDLRDTLAALYRGATGKQRRNINAQGVTVPVQNLGFKSGKCSNSTLEFSSLAVEAEFVDPRLDKYHNNNWGGPPYPPPQQTAQEPQTIRWETSASAAVPVIPEPRTRLRTELLRSTDYITDDVVDVIEDSQERYGRFDRLLPKTNRMSRSMDVTGYSGLPIPPPPPPRVRRSSWDKEDDNYRRQPRQRVWEQQDISLPHYKWSKKHKQRRSTRERTRRTRESPDEWYTTQPAGARLVPAPRR